MRSLRPVPPARLDPGAALLLQGPRWAPARPSPAATVVVVVASSRPDAAPACARPRPLASGAPQPQPPPPRHSKSAIYVEEHIEKVVYRCRFLTMFGVLGSLMGSVLCFLKGCVYVIDSFGDYFARGGNVTMMVIEATDVYLIGTVMLVFGMGLYELFISNFDIAKTSSYGSNLLGLFKLPARPKWLEIQSVNELKTKLGHVIVMVLLIGLFEKSRKVTITSPIDLLCFASSIFLSSSCLYLLTKLHSK